MDVRGGAAQCTAARALLDKDRVGDDGFEGALETEMDMFCMILAGSRARNVQIDHCDADADAVAVCGA